MSTLDILLLICLVPSAIQGFRKGLIEQLVGVISVILGAWLSFKFSNLVCGLIKPYLQVSEAVLNIVAFVLIFVAVIFGLYFVGKIVKGAIKLVMLGWFDKLLGLAFGLFKAALIVGLVLILFDTLNTKFELVSAEKLSGSVLYGPVKDFAYFVFPYMKALLFKQ